METLFSHHEVILQFVWIILIQCFEILRIDVIPGYRPPFSLWLTMIHADSYPYPTLWHILKLWPGYLNSYAKIDYSHFDKWSMFWLGVPVYVIEYMYKRTRKQQDIYKIMYVCMYKSGPVTTTTTVTNRKKNWKG